MPEQPAADIPDGYRCCESPARRGSQRTAEAVQQGDIVKIADAIGDIAYVAVGTAVTYGIPFDDIYRGSPPAANMTKVNTPDEAKLVKGPDYQPPDIASTSITAPPGRRDRGHRCRLHRPQSTWDNALRHPVFGCGDPGRSSTGHRRTRGTTHVRGMWTDDPQVPVRRASSTEYHKCGKPDCFQQEVSLSSVYCCHSCTTAAEAPAPYRDRAVPAGRSLGAGPQ